MDDMTNDVRFTRPDLEEMITESDVEQKLVYPLLVGTRPSGLGLHEAAILTKVNIRRLSIGKGKERKVYYPDYLVLIDGHPLLVVEVKTPGEELADAFREARLYATELNATYPAGVNPLTKTLVCNGRKIMVGLWDQAEPKLVLNLSDLNPSSELMAELGDLVGITQLRKDLANFAAYLRPAKYWKPRRLLGGESVQQGEIGHNSFGATVTADFSHIFNPSSQEDREMIATKGYIASKRRERYLDPIDRVIRASRPQSETESVLVQDTSNPREVLERLKQQKQKPLDHQVLLIVGSVGSGKSTFVDHLQYAALSDELKASTIWVRLNMNNAPSVQSEIYDWMRTEMVEGCRSAYPEIDFDDLTRLKSVFAVEVRKWEIGVGRLYAVDRQVHGIKLGELIESLLKDSHKQAVAYARHCATERGKLLVLVMDNCDKRNLDQQLLMFEAAQWLQKEFRALVILPLREETYDNHRDRPPLDTALKDLVFRIEPPLFHSVLVSRVQLAVNEISSGTGRVNRYELPNGFHVQYPDSDKAYYLSSIVHAVFQYDKQIRRMIVGLSARNIRRALEIFLELCRSGHIGEDEIFKIRQSNGKYILPLALVIRVLLRMNRRFYDSDPSYVKNVLALDPRDTRPNYFTRLIILRWLQARFSQQGPSIQKGYFPIRDVANDLSIFGIDLAVVVREMEYLASAQCVITEDFRTDRLTKDDLVRLGPAGFVHLELLGGADYLAAVSEDMWFEDEDTARRVAERIKKLEKHYELGTALANAREVLNSVEAARARDASSVNSLIENSSFDELTDVAPMIEALNQYEASLIAKPWQGVSEKYPVSKEVVGLVTNVKDFGVFVELEPGVSGLIPASRLPKEFRGLDQFDAGERVVVRPLNIDPLNSRMGLTYVRPAEPAEYQSAYKKPILS